MLRSFKLLELIVLVLKTFSDECWTETMAYAQELLSNGSRFSFPMSI